MIGTQVSHYRLVRKLGAGTYGEVWEAEHVHSPNLRVAVKVVAPALVQDPQFVDALTRECLQLDKLDHPNIVRLRDLVVNEGQVAMVLELLDGQDLHERLRSGTLAVESAVAVVEAVLEGLGHAHARGVLHRDIKPGNVFWCDDGRVKVLDFGIARAADGTQATKTGQLVGTFDYMAPERFTGDGGSAASDVYAVGLVAWELLAGRAACPEGEPGRKMGWHLAQGVGDADTVVRGLPGCPRWLAEVVASLAAKDPAVRPADGAAALGLLREKRAGDGTAAAPAERRAPPPPTVDQPAPVVSIPPVASSVPPVSVPPIGTGRSAPPETVVGPAPTPSAPLPSGRSAAPDAKERAWGRALAALATSVPAPSPVATQATPPTAPANDRPSTSKLPLLLGVALAFAGGAWFALRGPSVASIELEPRGELSFEVGSDVAAPTARALDEKGNVVAGVEIVCASDTPTVRLRDGKLSATEAAKATVTCAAGGAEGRFVVEAYLPGPMPNLTSQVEPTGNPLPVSDVPSPGIVPPRRATPPPAKSNPVPPSFRDPAEATGKGLISLGAIPRAQVQIDGVVVGYTPMHDLGVAAGTHTITLVAENYRAKQFQLNVPAGGKAMRIYFFAEGRFQAP